MIARLKRPTRWQASKPMTPHEPMPSFETKLLAGPVRLRYRFEKGDGIPPGPVPSRRKADDAYRTRLFRGAVFAVGRSFPAIPRFDPGVR